MFPQGEPSTMQFILSFIFSTIFAFICAYYAEKKGRSPLGWFILGFLFTFISLIVLFFLSSLKKENGNLPTMTVMPPDPDMIEKEEALTPPPFEKYKEENQLWFYLDQDHQQIGPVSLIALRALWNRGLLELNSYVWTEGMDQWKKVDQLPELKAVLNRPA